MSGDLIRTDGHPYYKSLCEGSSSHQFDLLHYTGEGWSACFEPQRDKDSCQGRGRRGPAASRMGGSEGVGLWEPHWLGWDPLGEPVWGEPVWGELVWGELVWSTNSPLLKLSSCSKALEAEGSVLGWEGMGPSSLSDFFVSPSCLSSLTLWTKHIREQEDYGFGRDAIDLPDPIDLAPLALDSDSGVDEALSPKDGTSRGHHHQVLPSTVHMAFIVSSCHDNLLLHEAANTPS